MPGANAVYSPLVEKAMRWAARSHRTQMRKASDLPYISHPASVALILARAGFADDDMLAAALLHDAVEDTPCTAEQLMAGFPPAVCESVAWLTERKCDEHGTPRDWESRKHDHIVQMAHAPFAARAIMLADRLHNLGSILYDWDESGAETWTRFNAPRERILWYQRHMIDAAAQDDDRLHVLATACREILAQLEARD